MNLYISECSPFPQPHNPQPRMSVWPGSRPRAAASLPCASSSFGHGSTSLLHSCSKSLPWCCTSSGRCGCQWIEVHHRCSAFFRPDECPPLTDFPHPCIYPQLTVEVLSLIADILLKPLLQLLHNGFVQPIFVFFFHLFSAMAVGLANLSLGYDAPTTPGSTEIATHPALARPRSARWSRPLIY